MSYRCVNQECANYTAALPVAAAQSLNYKCFICQSDLEEPPIELSAVIDSIDSIPASLQILPKLQELLGNINSSMVDIISLIEKDPSLVSHIIKLSNSAYYSAATHCMTVEEAMNRIGFTEAYKMVGLVAAGQVLEGDLELYGIHTEDLWETCVLTATLMQYLAPRIKTNKDYSIPISGVAYTIGLLHQVGRILINHYHKASPFSCLEGFEGKLSPTKEKELFGFDNFEAGAALLKKWNFSHEITTPIHFQDRPKDSAEVDADTQIIALINICRDAIHDLPRNLIKKDAKILYKSYEPNEEYMSLAGIDKDQLFDGLGEAVHEYDVLARSLR